MAKKTETAAVASTQNQPKNQATMKAKNTYSKKFITKINKSIAEAKRGELKTVDVENLFNRPTKNTYSRKFIAKINKGIEAIRNGKGVRINEKDLFK